MLARVGACSFVEAVSISCIVVNDGYSTRSIPPSQRTHHVYATGRCYGAGDEISRRKARYDIVLRPGTPLGGADGVFLGGPETMRLVKTNPSLQRMLGGTGEKLREITVYDILDADLSGMRGMEVIHEIRGVPALTDTRLMLRTPLGWRGGAPLGGRGLPRQAHAPVRALQLTGDGPGLVRGAALSGRAGAAAIYQGSGSLLPFAALVTKPPEYS